MLRRAPQQPQSAELSSQTVTLDLLHRHPTYAREQNVLSDGLLQNSRGLPNRWRDVGVARYDDNADTLLMQLIDQAVGLLTVPQVDVYQGHVGGALANQAHGFGRGCGWAANNGSPRFKQHLQSRPDVPRILDDEDAETVELRGIGFERVTNERRGHAISRRCLGL